SLAFPPRSSWATSRPRLDRAFLRPLNDMVHTILFSEMDVHSVPARRDFSRCDYCRLVLYERWEDIRSQALADAHSADIVMTATYLPGGHLINAEILELSGPLRVFYDLDTPVTLRNLEAGGVEYVRRDQLPAFDLVLSFTGGKVLDEL